MGRAGSRTGVLHASADMIEPETETLRQRVIALVKAAMQLGYTSTRIGYAIGDGAFVPKLQRGHRHKYSTLLRAHRNLEQLLAKSSDLPSFLQDSA